MLHAMIRLTPNAAAERCGKSRATILRAVAAKSLPAEKIGGQWAIDVLALDLWASERPQRAHRRPVERQSAGNGASGASKARSALVSAPEVSDETLALTARLDALEALYSALRVEMDALRRQASIQPVTTPPQAPKDASENITPAKRRRWPFSAKS